MLLHVPGVLDAGTLARCLDTIRDAPWADGRITAGSQSAQVKNNLQLPGDDPAAVAAGAIVLQSLEHHPLFFAAALPKRIFPPLFNRYGGDRNAFGNHVDNAVRTVAADGRRLRTDLSATLFLGDPASYDGGELVIEDTFGPRSVKLPAGDLVLYPSTSIHRVEPVTRGVRLASFFWIESMVRGESRRSVLFELDMAILALRSREGESNEAIRLTGVYHNLLRMWADV